MYTKLITSCYSPDAYFYWDIYYDRWEFNYPILATFSDYFGVCFFWFKNNDAVPLFLWVLTIIRLCCPRRAVVVKRGRVLLLRNLLQILALLREVSRRNPLFLILSVGYDRLSLSPFRYPVIRPRYAVLASGTLPPRRDLSAFNSLIMTAFAAPAISGMTPLPKLTIKGRWQEKLRFTSGQKLEVITMPGQLTIRLAI